MLPRGRLLATGLVVTLAAVSLRAAPTAAVLAVREWRAQHERQILAELVALVSLPNVAANRADIVKNADAITTLFEKRGFTVSRIQTPGSPVVLAERAGPAGSRVLTFYMHYDGQPTEPKDWTRGQPWAPAAFLGDARVDLGAGSGPVDPETRVYGRSAADDKGPIIAFLSAMDGLAAARVAVPWTLRVVLDGEEEAGSPNFTAAMVANAGRIRSDLAVIVDSPRHPSSLPTVFYGSRGLTGATITVFGPNGDLHSGNYGNFATDPAMLLARLLASMKDDKGEVTIKGFYDDVVPLTASERRAIDEIPNIDQTLLDRFGLAQAEHPDSRIELQHNRPTLSVVGLQSGTVGAGARNAISAQAVGRVEIRLVNGMSAERQYQRLLAHIREQGFFLVDAPPDAATRKQHARIAMVTQAGNGFPIGKGNMDDPRTKMAADAIRALDQRLVQMPTIGGSLPFDTFSDHLRQPTIGLAVVNFDNNQHAVNENLRVGHLWEAIDIFAALATMER